MPDTVQTLVDEVLSVAEVDSPTALRVLNRRYRSMVARSRCLRKRVAVGNTVAGTAFYPLDVIELYSLEVAGVPYGKARRPDIYGYSQGTLLWVGPAGGGLIVADASTAGVKGLTLIPAPTTTGAAITAYAAVKPTDMALVDDVATLVIDDDFHEALVEGAQGTLLRRIGEGDPDALDARFEAACEEQRRRTQRRFRGGGPAQIRVEGLSA